MAAAKSKTLSLAAISGVIQSAIWIAASVTAVFVYMCVLEVTEYKTVSDFFRITLIKLYFEGRQCILDGTYLGQFNSEYNDPDKISLLTPDIVFAAMIVYAVLHVGQFFLSFSLYKANKKEENEKKLLSTVLNWSVVTIGISALDAFLAAEFIWDMLKLMDYMDENSDVASDIKGIEYVPLVLGLVSSRLILLWLWNVYVAASSFLCGMCCSKVLGIRKEKVVAPPEPPAPPRDDPKKPDIYTIPSWQPPSDINKVVGRFPLVKGEQNRAAENKEVPWNPSRPKEGPSKERDEKKDVFVEITNEGFVKDNEEPVFVKEDKDADFAHRLENFDQGKKKVGIQEPPLGMFVKPPVAPVVVGPENASYNC